MTTSANEQGRGRVVEPTRIRTPARIFALALIALVAVGLAYVRFAPPAASVSVPAGARAGDLNLTASSYATENGSYAADSGTLVVPENRTNPRSRLIALPLVRIRAIATSHQAAEPIFWLVGGPGHSNMDFPMASRFAVDRDVVLVGYRGVDGSVRLDCPEVESALAHSTDFLGEQSFRAYGDGFRSCARRLTDSGVDLTGYSMAQLVDDLETARIALGYGSIDLLSESAGTRTAMIYAWRYPESIHRSAMVAVNPPGNFMWDPKTTDEQIGRYSALCANDGSCRKRTDDLAASMRWTAAHMPDHWLFLPIKEGNVRVASFFGLMESTPAAAPVTGPTTLDAWLSAAEGDASGFWFASVASDVLFPSIFVWGEYAAMGVQDTWRTQAFYAAGGDPGSILGNAGTDYVWAGGRLGEVWPASPDDAEYSQVRSSMVETVLVGGELDGSTPPQVATKELLPYLPNGQQVILAGFGHTTSFWSDQTEAGSRLLNTFFATGRVDESLYRPASINFTPEVTDTGLAKRIVGMMIGLSITAIASLVWIARRVQKRGAFGVARSGFLRALYPAVIGLGGWCLGAFIVLTITTAVPLDDELVTVLSVSIPIGLWIYWAWVHVDWSGATRTTGFVAALSGGLLAGWLGFNATGGYFAIVTTIVGATLGANLALILLGIARDRSARLRFDAANPEQTLNARTSTV